MRLLCRLGRHIKADGPSTFHRGLFFSRCAACGAELIRRSGEGRWTGLPRGSRVVWRSRADAPAKPASSVGSQRRQHDTTLAAYLGLTSQDS